VIAAAAATPAVAAGEPKNQPPFTRPVQSPPTVVVTNPDDGFSWVDAAIGAAAGVGATCAAGALAALAWTTRRTAIAQ
jgi:hypothetical protein